MERKYSVDVPPRSPMPAEDIVSTIQTPFFVHDARDEGLHTDASRESLTLSALYMHNSTPLYPNLRKSFGIQRLLTSIRLENGRVCVEICSYGDDGSHIELDDLTYINKAGKHFSLADLLSGNVDKLSRFPSHVNRIISNACFCGSNMHLTNKRNFSGIWIKCDVCGLSCHKECIGILSSCPQCS